MDIRPNDLARVELDASGEVVGEVADVEQPAPGHTRVWIQPFDDDHEMVNASADRVEVSR